jgi:hypothetical protein
MGESEIILFRFADIDVMDSNARDCIDVRAGGVSYVLVSVYVKETGALLFSTSSGEVSLTSTGKM